MNYPSSKLTAIVDYQADFRAVAITDDIQIPDEKQELKKCLLQNWHHYIEDEISKRKTAKDINILLQERHALSGKREELQKMVKERMKVKKISDDKKTFYDKLLNLYRKNLGFEIVSAKDVTEESDVTFVFKNINKKNPQETYSISLVTDGLKYKVTSCQPMIDSLDELVKTLCESNNLEKFILQVRRKFCVISSTNNTK